jgi:hypothetical protein
MKIKSFTQKSLRLATTVLTLLIVGECSMALADEWPENAETCARLGSLVTAGEIEKLIDRKPVVIKPATPTSFDSCTMEIEIPGAQTLLDDKVGIVLRLKQHMSPKTASDSIQGILVFAGADKVKNLAQDPRGLVVRFEGGSILGLAGNNFALAGVDATELQVTVRDKSIDAPKVTTSLGESVFKRALASDAIAHITASVEDVGIYMHMRPFIAMVDRCKREDIPSHTELSTTMSSSALKQAVVPAITSMSPYSQRSFAAHGYDGMVNAQLKRIAEGPLDVLERECAKLTASLPEFEKSLPDKILKALTKAAN